MHLYHLWKKDLLERLFKLAVKRMSFNGRKFKLAKSNLAVRYHIPEGRPVQSWNSIQRR